MVAFLRQHKHEKQLVFFRYIHTIYYHYLVIQKMPSSEAMYSQMKALQEQVAFTLMDPNR